MFTFLLLQRWRTSLPIISCCPSINKYPKITRKDDTNTLGPKNLKMPLRHLRSIFQHTFGEKLTQWEKFFLENIHISREALLRYGFIYSKIKNKITSVDPQPPLVTGRTGLHDNATSADACRWSTATNVMKIHVKWAHFWKIVKKSGIRNWIIDLKFFSLERENSLLHVKKIQLSQLLHFSSTD